jgi:hypothetical protein
MPQKGTKSTKDTYPIGLECDKDFCDSGLFLLGCGAMTLTAKDVYNSSVKKLSHKERLRLATMILNDMVARDENIEYSDSWTEQDLQDLTAFALSHSENPHEKERSKP